MLHVVLYNWLRHGQSCLQNMRTMKNHNSGILFYTFFLRQNSSFLVTDSWHLIYLWFIYRPCAEMILRFQRAAGQGQLKVTYEKYLLSDRSCVAGIKAIDRLPLWYKLCFVVSFFFFSFRVVLSVLQMWSADSFGIGKCKFGKPCFFFCMNHVTMESLYNLNIP